MAEQEDEYRKVIALLAKLEPKAGEEKEATIDLSALFAPRGKVAGKGYWELVDEMGGAAPRRQARAEEAAQQPRASSAAQLQVAQHKVAAGEAEMSRRAGTVREEMEGAFRRLGAERHGPVRIESEGNDLVLPRLSLPDQVEELGRIIEGLRERMFSGEQLAVVREELKGLERAARRGGAVGEESLLSLRGERLSEALRLLAGAADEGG